MYQPTTPTASEDFLTEEPSFTLARKSKRWGAAAIDFTLYFIILFICAYCFGEPTVDEDGSTSFYLTGIPAAISMIVPWFVLLPLMEGINKGQTLGKLIFKVRTADMAGNKISLSLAIARHLFDFVDFFPFFGIVGLLVASNNSHKQRVGDLVAKTIVVEA